MIKIRVDGREITAEEGTTLLEACLESGIYIPNLCHLPGMKEPHASCRLCFVDLEGEAQPLPSCTVTVRDGLEARTDTPRVRDLQKTALRLLLSVHRVDCGRCPANKRCELQKIAKFLGVGLKPKGLDQFLKEPEVVKEHPFIDYYPNRCVLCARCVRTCLFRSGRPMMTFARRGFDTLISFYGTDEGEPLPCQECQACVKACPVAAITLRHQPV
jgi:bidirectional [NiFe] hydrogenase diaphorase subunit